MTTSELESSLGRAADGLDIVRTAIPASTQEELQRLQQLCAALIATITVRQHNFANEIERFADAPTAERLNSFRQFMKELATEVTRMFKLLAREQGDFTIEKQASYRKLMQGLADRQTIYRELEQIPFPPMPEDVASLHRIVKDYRRLRSALIRAQEDIADYISKHRSSTAPVAARTSESNDHAKADVTLVVLVHGIRDRARWHSEIAKPLAAAGFLVEPTNHGRINLIEFLLPIPYFRKRAYEEVLSQLKHAMKLHPSATKISVIAHSFGTYVVSKILEREPTMDFDRIIFCGSVVSFKFKFDRYTHRFKPPLLNEVGTADPWPAVADSVTFGYGSAGTFGFNKPGVKDRYFLGKGHGDFLNKQFCKKYWVPFLTDGTVVEAGINAERPRWVNWISIVKIKWLLFAVGLCLLIWWLSSPSNISGRADTPSAPVLTGREALAPSVRRSPR